jgi:hypothetical protein
MYQTAFHWVHAAYVDGPRRRLTAVQVARGCGVDASVCAEVLDDLVRAKILARSDDHEYTLARRDVARADQSLPQGPRGAPAP